MDKTVKESAPPAYMPVWQPPVDDEINLLDLWRVLVAQKAVIMLTALVVMLGGVGYVLLATPVYQAKVVFMPPNQKHIEPLKVTVDQYMQGNMQGNMQSHVKGVNAESVYALFKRNLGSRALQYAFFQASGVLGQWREAVDGSVTDEELFEGFQKLLDVETQKKHEAFLALTVSWQDVPNMAARLANNYSQYVQQETVRQLIQDRQVAIQYRIQRLENDIAARRASAKQRRLDDIDKLEEALTIASQIGLVESSKDKIAVTVSTREEGIMQIPLYLRGTKALQAELLVLKGRTSDDPFIEGLRDLQESLDQLKAISFDAEQVRVARIDQAAYPPTSPYKPKRQLIVLLSAVLGLMLGVFVALFMAFLAKQREAE